MHDHRGVVAALLITLGLVIYYAACQRRDRIRAEDERDLYEDEIVRAHESDTQMARLRERRDRAAHTDVVVELASAVGVIVPAVQVPHIPHVVVPHQRKEID